MVSKFDNSIKKIFVAGHMGMVGRAIVKELSKKDNNSIITKTRDELDLTNSKSVAAFLDKTKVDQIYIAAAKVGGIYANNKYPAEFIYQNLMIESNLIHQAHLAGVQKLLFLGSSCIYPKMAKQPINESELLNGHLEPTNEPYAIAKIAGIKLCESYNRQYGRDYRSLMPTNLYGPFDNFDPQNSHVIPALMRRFHEATQSDAPSVTVWGSGKPMREFLFVDDLAKACVHVMDISTDHLNQKIKPMQSHLNVGTGLDCSIAELANTVAKVTGFKGIIQFDTKMPDGTPRKLLDVSRLNELGWQAETSLENGLQITYQWFLQQLGILREA